MPDFTSLDLEGRLGGAPEMRYTPDGVPVANASFAVNRRVKDGDDVPTWYRLTFWRKNAETINQYAVKGQVLHVHCRDLEVKTYDKKDGTTGVSLETTVVYFDFGTKPKGAQQAETDEDQLPF